MAQDASRPLRAGNSPALVLRQYCPGDWKAMYALDVICFDPPFRFSQREMRRLAEQRDSITLLAECRTPAATDLAGFCIVHREGTWGYLVTLDVAPAWRRRGTAARLLHQAEHELQSAGTKGMGLHVYTGNDGAIRFYERMGYTRVGVQENFYGAAKDALIYRRVW